ncbi:hypothetical protein D3C72_661040 [compost metagenome]
MHPLQGLVGGLGHLPHRGLHLGHGGGDRGGLLTLFLQIRPHRFGGVAVVVGGAVELGRGLGELPEHVSHLLDQQVDLAAELAELVLALEADPLGHVTLGHLGQYPQQLFQGAAYGLAEGEGHQDGDEDGDDYADPLGQGALGLHPIGGLDAGVHQLLALGGDPLQLVLDADDELARLLALLAHGLLLLHQRQVLGEHPFIGGGVAHEAMDVVAHVVVELLELPLQILDGAVEALDLHLVALERRFYGGGDALVEGIHGGELDGGELGGQGLGEHLDEAVVDGDHHVAEVLLELGQADLELALGLVDLVQPGEQGLVLGGQGLGQLQVVSHQLAEGCHLPLQFGVRRHLLPEGRQHLVDLALGLLQLGHFRRQLLGILLGQHVGEPLVGAEQAYLGLAAGDHQRHGLLCYLVQGIVEFALAAKGQYRAGDHDGDQDGKAQIDSL